MRKIAIFLLFCVLALVFSQDGSENPAENSANPSETSDSLEETPENKPAPGPSDDFIREWEQVMGDFIPEDISTFKMQAKSTEVSVS